jgi:hypothetical protein
MDDTADRLIKFLERNEATVARMDKVFQKLESAFSPKKSGSSEIGLRTVKPSDNALWVKRGAGENINDCWHFMKGDLQVFCKHNAITGKLVGISTKNKTFEGKTSTKVTYTLDANGTIWYIKTSLDVVFNRGVLLGLIHVPQNRVQDNLSFMVAPSDEVSGKGAQVVFGRILLDDNEIVAAWDSEINLYSLLKDVAEYFGIAISTDSTDQSPAKIAPTKTALALAPVKADEEAVDEETYEVKGVALSIPNARRYFFDQVMQQVKRLEKDSKWGAEFVSNNFSNRGLKELGCNELEALVVMLKARKVEIATPVLATVPPEADDDLPF